MDVDYQKYLKYKTKYFNLKKLLQVGGDNTCKIKQDQLASQNKSPMGEILKNTPLYKDLKSLEMIKIIFKGQIISVAMTQECDGKTYHYSIHLNGWIDSDAIKC